MDDADAGQRHRRRGYARRGAAPHEAAALRARPPRAAGGARCSTLAMVHLEREEFRAAEYYAEQVDSLRDEATAGISLPLRLLVEQRRAERRREQGRLMEAFGPGAHERLDKLRADRAESPMAEDLTHLARSEVFDSLGDKAKARSELEAVTVDETTPAPIVEAYYQYADGFYRELDDREALVALCRELSTNSALRPDEQLRYARAAVRAMVRGLPYADADARLARERAGANARRHRSWSSRSISRVLCSRSATPTCPRQWGTRSSRSTPRRLARVAAGRSSSMRCSGPTTWTRTTCSTPGPAGHPGREAWDARAGGDRGRVRAPDPRAGVRARGGKAIRRRARATSTRSPSRPDRSRRSWGRSTCA